MIVRISPVFHFGLTGRFLAAASRSSSSLFISQMVFCRVIVGAVSNFAGSSMSAGRIEVVEAGH